MYPLLFSHILIFFQKNNTFSSFLSVLNVTEASLYVCQNCINILIKWILDQYNGKFVAIRQKGTPIKWCFWYLYHWIFFFFFRNSFLHSSTMHIVERHQGDIGRKFQPMFHNRNAKFKMIYRIQCLMKSPKST